MKLSEELIERGFVHQFVGESLESIVDGPKRTIYHGIDPTAGSAHAGNFVVWIFLRHCINAGHKVVFLVGGGTGMIGDPKPDVERTLASRDEVQGRVDTLNAQARILLSEDVVFVDNYDWLGSLNLIEFLRDTGKHFSVNELIKKDAIATRLSNETGLSYTEFAYPLLQAFDYLKLHELHGCNVQIGGSDQWGNIVAGVDLIRRKTKEEVFAITTPLVIDKVTGKKFGKSEGNAVWLDPEQTSPYAFYQFWLNTSDENVIDYLKLFTFLELSEITRLQIEVETNPGKREAQTRLALEVTSFVHGKEQSDAVHNVSQTLFGGGDVAALSVAEKTVLLENAPVSEISSGALLGEVLVGVTLATSKREARTFIESGAVSIDGEKVMEDGEIIGAEGSLKLLKRGKKQLVILKFK